jgi:4-hydroxybenzoate polyprenyltransferase
MTEPRQREDSLERRPREESSPPEPTATAESPARRAESSPAPPAASGFRASALWAWLELFRVPNLLTVPGDAIAGFLLARSAGLSANRPYLRMAMAAAVSLLIYAAGLLWNDWFDLPEDLRQRPSRPLPSGRVRAGHVALAANVLVAAAISVAAIAGQATLWTAAVLGAVVLAYDMALKRVRLIGALAMGCCRGLSVLVGAAALGADGLTRAPVIAAAAGITLYVAAVTWLARGETRQRPVGRQTAAIAAAFVVWLTAVGAAIHGAEEYDSDWRWAMLLVACMAGLWVAACLATMGRNPEPPAVQHAVGGLIRGIILVQAALVLATGWTGLTIAIALMACFLLNRVLGRLFYAS